MQATFRLMQESGVTGPKKTFEIDPEVTKQSLKEQAVLWSEGQTGHPWDVLTVEVPEWDWQAEITK